MVQLKPESSSTGPNHLQSSISSEAVPGAIVQPFTESLSRMNGSTNGVSNNVEDIPSNESETNNAVGEWETFEVQYVGTGVSSYQTGVSDNDSDNSLVSDSDDHQYDGYLNLQNLQSYYSTESDDEIIDGPLKTEVTPTTEEPPFVPSAFITDQRPTLPASSVSASPNDIHLDQERVNQITSAMAGFTLPPHPNMPNDTALLEMVKRLTGN